MHFIQRKILDKLIYNKEQSYTQMRPEGIESNHFAYHLKQLIRGDLVERIGRKYQLSTNGKAYVDTISYQTLEFRRQPKIITMFDITNSKGETVLYQRKNQPYIDMIGYPTGKMHLGETLFEAAKREIEEKVGLTSIELRHRGMVYIAISESGVLISQVLAHVFQATFEKDLPSIENRRAKVFWGNPEEVSATEKFIPGFFDIKKLLQKKDIFFEELAYKI